VIAEEEIGVGISSVGHCKKGADVGQEANKMMPENH